MRPPSAPVLLRDRSAGEDDGRVRASIGVGCCVMHRAPDLDTKTAATDPAAGTSLTDHAWAYEHDRTGKICVLDLERADRGYAAIGS